MLAEIGMHILKSVILYAIVLAVFRLMGKRSMGHMAPFDWAVLIMIGEAAALPMDQEGFKIEQGVVPILTLTALQLIVAEVNMHWRGFERITQGVAKPLIKQGRLVKDNLSFERITEADLQIALREKGITNLNEVEEANLEPTGKVSVIKVKDKRALTQSDMAQVTAARLDAILEENLRRLQGRAEQTLAEISRRKSGGG
ncbi:MAG TPA: YetF domain-containing protein [Bacillota bacterium]|jgi:uncharacterized membrane protein YcaP (DUF421 family)